MAVCEKCGGEHDGSFGSGRFCSKVCANSRNFDGRKIKASCVKCGADIECSCNTNKEFRFCPSCKSMYLKEKAEYKACKIAKNKDNIRFAKMSVDIEMVKFKSLSKRTQAKIMRRLGTHCSHCNFYCDGITLDIHHIVPRKKGGSDETTNLSYLCPNCHRMAHNGLILSFVSMADQIGDSWKKFYYVK